MGRLTWCAVMALVGLCVPAMAHAEVDVTGDTLLKYCVADKPDALPNDQDERDQVVKCLGYVQGAVDMMFAINRVVFCIPDKHATHGHHGDHGGLAQTAPGPEEVSGCWQPPPGGTREVAVQDVRRIKPATVAKAA